MSRTATAAASHGAIAIEGGSRFYRDLKWSPDEKRVSFLDNAYSLYVLELEAGARRASRRNDYFGHVPVHFCTIWSTRLRSGSRTRRTATA
jgi:hypothetical protein